MYLGGNYCNKHMAVISVICETFEFECRSGNRFIGANFPGRMNIKARSQFI